MKALLDRLPIRHKLIALIMLTTTAVLVVAGVIFVVSDYLRARRDVLNDLVAQAGIVLENSTTAMRFNDTSTADARRGVP